MLMFKRVFGFLVAIGFLYGAAWLGAAYWLRSELQASLSNLAQRGYAFAHGEMQLVGFPGSVGISIPGLSIVAPAAEGGWRWEADRPRVSLHLRAPREPVIDLAGTHRVRGLVSGEDEGFTLTVRRGTARLAFAQGEALENIALDLNETMIAGGNGAEAVLGIKEGSIQLSLATGHMTLSARDITPAQPVPVLNPSIAALDFTLDFTGPVPSGPLLESLEAWRAAGGAVELRDLALDWPPLRAAGSGTFALDPALQPMGAATMTFQGFFALIEALVQEGHVHEREAEMAKAVLGMMAKPSASGEPELSLPLTVQDRRLSAGPIVLMEVPAISWDEAARVP